MLDDHTELDDTVLSSETAAAMRGLASSVTDAPPLRLAPRVRTGPARRRIGRRWAVRLTPLAAAAVVAVLAVTLVTLRSNQNGPVVPAAKPVSVPGSVPTYYAQLVQEPGNANNPDQIQVRETMTGDLIATVKPPSGATFAGLTGAADDRTFVVDTQPGAIQSLNTTPNQQSVKPRTWYLLRLSPGSARPAALSQLTIPPSPAGTAVMGMALSPDGTKLAVAFQTPGWGISPAGSMTLRVYSVRSGTVLRSWTAPYGKDRYLFPPAAAGSADDNLSLAWTGNGAVLAFGELNLPDHLVNDGALPPQQDLSGEKILELPYATPSGANLLSARAAFTFPGKAQDTSAVLRCGEAATTDLVFTADGQLLCGGTATNRDPGSLVAGCAPGTPRYQVGLLEYSASGAARTLEQYTSNCPGQWELQPMWSSPSGSTQLGLLSLQKSAADTSFAFGTFRNGKFTALPIPAALSSQQGFPFPLSSIAW